MEVDVNCSGGSWFGYYLSNGKYMLYRLKQLMRPIRMKDEGLLIHSLTAKKI